jgi:hypothetical protein
MPFVSQAQRKKCWAMKGQGEAGSWDCEEWQESTPKKLPEHIKKEAVAVLADALAAMLAKEGVLGNGGMGMTVRMGAPGQGKGGPPNSAQVHMPTTTTMPGFGSTPATPVASPALPQGLQPPAPATMAQGPDAHR